MLTMKDIIRDGHLTLSQTAKDVLLPLSTEDVHIGQEMMEFLINSQDEELSAQLELRAGVGLAAPQINILKRIIAIHAPIDEETHLSKVMYNPKIISHSEKLTYLPSGEGCLSVDNEIEGIVPRYKKITVRFTNINNIEEKQSFTDFESIVIQHEIDHLNGIMFYERINKENPLLPPENSTPLD